MDLVAQQQKALSIKSFLHKDSIKSQLASALPKWLSPDRLLRVVYSSMLQNPKLLECTTESILNSVMKCAQLGLEPILGRAYLIPYNRNVKQGMQWVKKLECTFQPGYQGLVDIARRSGEISNVTAHVVYSADTFELSLGTDEHIKHIPYLKGDRGNPIGAYTVWTYKDYNKTFDFMSTSDIEKVRSKSQAKDSGPWVEHWSEMAKKTVVKRHAKLQPASIEFQEAIHLDNQAEAGNQQMDLLPIEPTAEDLTQRLKAEEKGEVTNDALEAIEKAREVNPELMAEAMKALDIPVFESDEDIHKVLEKFDELVDKEGRSK